MAANYSQYTDHNEIGGVSVGLEDAKLAAADSVDEVASTDCVLMKDASGNPVKILKDDFNEAVRDALGSILSKSELGTSIGRVAALRSSDNDFGSISTSDLASLLGAVVKGVISDENTADTTLEPGIYYGNSYPNLNQNHIIIVLHAYACHCQISILSDPGALIQYRVVYNRNTFSGISWKTISTT